LSGLDCGTFVPAAGNGAAVEEAFAARSPCVAQAIVVSSPSGPYRHDESLRCYPDIVFCSGAAEKLVTNRPHLRFVTDLGVTVAAALRRVVKSMPLSVEPRG
jgi:hypothetical protein